MFHCCWYPVHEIGGFFFCVITFYVIIVHWLLRIDEVYDTFHLRCLSLPLVSNQNMSITPFLFLFSSDMFAMLTLVVTKFIQDKVNIFQCICCGSFQIYLLVVAYCSAHTDNDTCLNSVPWSLPRLFLHACSQNPWCLPLSNCSEFFHVWQWHFTESLPTIHVLIWINTFLQSSHLPFRSPSASLLARIGS